MLLGVAHSTACCVVVKRLFLVFRRPGVQRLTVSHALPSYLRNSDLSLPCVLLSSGASRCQCFRVAWLPSYSVCCVCQPFVSSPIPCWLVAWKRRHSLPILCSCQPQIKCHIYRREATERSMSHGTDRWSTQPTLYHAGNGMVIQLVPMPSHRYQGSKVTIAIRLRRTHVAIGMPTLRQCSGLSQVSAQATHALAKRYGTTHTQPHSNAL